VVREGSTKEGIWGINYGELNKMDKKEALRRVREMDVKSMVRDKWGEELTPGQEDIVRRIAFRKQKRLGISAMTRYGKSHCVSRAIALLIDMGVPAKIAFIGPKQEQAGILRQYMNDLIVQDKDGTLLDKAQLKVKGAQRLQKEASRKRMTFKTGAEYRVFSAEGEANRLMGFGADILIIDERVLIPPAAEAKIGRMIGDNPDGFMIIELYNPWDRASKAYEHTIDPDWDYIHIGWEQAVEEGRTTKEFVDMQRKELTPIEFTILYESQFPLEAEDSLHSLVYIERAEKKRQYLYKQAENMESGIKALKDRLKKPISNELRDEVEETLVLLQKNVNKYTRIISCDPADKGRDEMVMFWGIENKPHREVIGYYSEPKTDSMEMVGKLVELAKSYIGYEMKGIIKIDKVGMGVGPLSRLKEVIHGELGMKNIQIMGCGAGEKAVKTDLFINQKAENNFRLKGIMEDDLISFPKLRKLRMQLMAMKWDLTSAGKKKIIDPEEKSPDWSDALVLFVWEGKPAFSFDFL